MRAKKRTGGVEPERDALGRVPPSSSVFRGEGQACRNPTRRASAPSYPSRISCFSVSHQDEVQALWEQCAWARPVVSRRTTKIFNHEHLIFLKKDFIDSFMRDPERGRDTGRGRSRLPAGSPMRDSIPGPRSHDLG